MEKGIYLIDLDEKGLRLVKTAKWWILPGGKPKGIESDYDCLYRELKEEMSVIKKQVVIYNFYKSFKDKTPCLNKDLEAKVYFGYIKGPVKSGNEINDICFKKEFDFELTPVMSQIISSLREDGYLK